jgi:hypothetical protein
MQAMSKTIWGRDGAPGANIGSQHNSVEPISADAPIRSSSAAIAFFMGKDLQGDQTWHSRRHRKLSSVEVNLTKLLCPQNQKFNVRK